MTDFVGISNGAASPISANAIAPLFVALPRRALPAQSHSRTRASYRNAYAHRRKHAVAAPNLICRAMPRSGPGAISGGDAKTAVSLGWWQRF